MSKLSDKTLAVIAAAMLMLVVFLYASQAHAYTCEDVRRAAHSWSPTEIAAQKQKMTPSQRAAAEKCLKDAGGGGDPRSGGDA